MRKIVRTIFAAPEHLAGPIPECIRSIMKEFRYDKTDQLIDKIPTQRRCGKCTKFVCVKCNIGHILSEISYTFCVICT